MPSLYSPLTNNIEQLKQAIQSRKVLRDSKHFGNKDQDLRITLQFVDKDGFLTPGAHGYFQELEGLFSNQISDEINKEKDEKLKKQLNTELNNAIS